MTIIVTSLNWVGQTAGVVAIFSLVLHCAFEFFALVDDATMMSAAWIMRHGSALLASDCGWRAR